jgi:hypothetical protein
MTASINVTPRKRSSTQGLSVRTAYVQVLHQNFRKIGVFFPESKGRVPSSRRSSSLDVRSARDAVRPHIIRMTFTLLTKGSSIGAGAHSLKSQKLAIEV